MTLKDFLTAFLGKTLNFPAEKVAGLLNPEGTELLPTALDELLPLDVAKVQKLKDENQTMFDNGVKKATKEILTDFEKSVKEKHGITSEKKGLELIEEIVAAKAGAPGKLDEAKVKAHPLYVELQDKLASEVTKVENTWKAKHEEFEKTVQKEKTFSLVIDKANALLADYELPKDETLKANQKKLLIDELNKFGFQDNKGDFVVLDAEGKVVEDGHGNRKSFDATVKEIAAKYWPKLEGQAREGAGGNNDTGGTGQSATKWNGKAPANDDEYASMIATAKTPADRIAITDAFDASRAGK